MAAFLTVDELRSFIGDPGLDPMRAQLVLDAVSDDIRDELGWSITEETDVIVTLDGTGKEHLFLPTHRLTAITTVVEDGVMLEAEVDYIWRESGIVTRIAGDARSPTTWTCKPRAVVVTFDHGYPDGQVPGVFKTVTLDHASALLANPGGWLRSETVGQVSVTYADARTRTTAGEDTRLSRYSILPGFG